MLVVEVFINVQLVIGTYIRFSLLLRLNDLLELLQYSSKVTSHLLTLFFQVARYTRSREESSVTQLDIVCEYLFFEASAHKCFFVAHSYM